MRLSLKRTKNVLLTALILSAPATFGQGKAVDSTLKGNYQIQTDKPEQYIWGLGFEIQSDAIGSGNLGLPEEPTSVPHDLVPAERERFYNDMLKGFRFCRLAGGLYFRGTTPDQKELRGRWATQTDELREMIEKAGIEGISLEYWSPTPFWKANGKYIGKDKENKLRCYGSNFKNDPVYNGDTTRFLNDFGESLVNDVHYFEKNRIPVKMWGLQNEPRWDTPYSSCVYDIDQYTQTFNTVAPKIKAFNPGILIIADSWEGPLLFAKKINANPETRQFVDAWAWHQIGANSNQLIDEQAKYHKETYGRPVFQNEYEYLSGGTSPKRCLNTVQNIMNWFTFVNSPTWFWIHALKPAGNAEAAGYALGFWKPLIQKEGTAPVAKPKGVAAGAGRTLNGLEIRRTSPELIGMKTVFIDRGDKNQPGKPYSFTVDQKSDVFIAVDALAGYVPPSGWKKTDYFVKWDREDVVYKRTFKPGLVEIPTNTGKNEKGEYGIPHLALVANAIDKEKPVKIVFNKKDADGYSEQLEARQEIDTENLQPGHWVYNNYNWFALAGFLKHMPWNSRRYAVSEDEVRKDQRILAYKTPEGKMVMVMTNRGAEPFTFNITCDSKASFKGFRYTPEVAGPNFEGTAIGNRSGEKLSVELPAMCWDFWVEQ